MNTFRDLLLIFSLALPLVACTNSSSDPSPKDTLVVGLNTKPATLDPRYTKDASGMRILNLMFHSFVKIGDKLQVVGDAAESWKWQGTSLELVVPKGLIFHDGTPVTKDDFEYTFEAYLAQDCPFRSSLEGLKEIKVVGTPKNWVITLSFEKFSAKFLNTDLPVIRILPAKLKDLSSEEFASHPIGTGVYAFAGETANSLKLKLAQTNSTAKIKNVEFKFIADENTLLNKLKKGNIHVVQNDIPRDKVESLKADANLKVVTYPGVAFSYILVNFKNPILAKHKVRQALAQAVDRESIITHKLGGLAEVATGLLTPATQFYDSSLPAIKYNLSAAKKLIEEAGLKGKSITLKTSNQRSARDNGFVLSKMLGQIGLKVKLESYEWSTFFSSVQKGQFDLATMRWVGSIDPDLYRIAFHSSEVPPGRNRGHYLNKDLDGLLEEGLEIGDLQKRREHYFKVQKMVLDDLAILPLWYDVQVAVIHKSVKGYHPVPNSDFSPILKATLE